MQVPTSFMRFKLALDGGESDAAAREVEALTACDGFTPEILQVGVWLDACSA